MHTLNTIGLICPEPIMLLHRTIKTLQAGQTLVVVATDPATVRDIPNFCQHLGHGLLAQSTLDSSPLPSQGDEIVFDTYYHYTIQKR